LKELRTTLIHKIKEIKTKTNDYGKKKVNNHSTFVNACKKIANVFGGHLLNPNCLSLNGRVILFLK
jgi:hypothetical protein